jgi:nucleotide-binding universal stress UspA family protein
MDTEVHAPHAVQAARRSPRVVVGVDGSPASIGALRAGARASAALGGRLVAVTAWGAPLLAPRVPAILPDLATAAATLLHEAVGEAFQDQPPVPVEEVVRCGGAAAVLLEEARGAAMVVVGSRGHGGFTGLLLGSVSMACAAHSRCPVLVVHTGDRGLSRTPGGDASLRVVVGVSDPAASTVLLRVAARTGSELHAEVLAVAAWNDGNMWPGAITEVHEEQAGRAEQRLAAQLAAAFPDGRPPRLRAELREGAAAAVLVAESRSADLVVVGRRARNGFASALLHSVGMQVAEHAAASVLVVPVTPVPAVEDGIDLTRLPRLAAA